MSKILKEMLSTIENNCNRLWKTYKNQRNIYTKRIVQLKSLENAHKNMLNRKTMPLFRK